MNTLSSSTKLLEIDARTLKELLDHDRVTIIDVREPGEYAGERIPGAILVPLSSFEPATIAPSDDKTLVLYCQSGRRSAQAAAKLLESGFPAISHLAGGLPTWKAAGYAVEGDANAPISLFRQVQIVAGSLVALGTLLGAFVSPWFLLLSGFVGCGLVFAGVTNTCALAVLLSKLPYNQRGKGS
jgi:rhodanese-related sulfurtransferase